MKTWIVMLLLVALAAGTGIVFDGPAVAAQKMSSAEAAQIRVNVNTAGVEELTQLNGVGEKIAQAIVDFREKNGSFETVDDLLQIKGIGEKKLAAIRDNIVLE